MSDYYDAVDFPVDGGDKPLTTDEVPSLESRPALLDRPWKRSSAFVQVQYIIRVPDSPDFSGVNAELILDLSGYLEFDVGRLEISNSIEVLKLLGDGKSIHDVSLDVMKVERPRLLLAPPFISHLSSFFTRSEDVEAVSAAVPRWEDAFHLHTPYTLQQAPGVLEISSQKPLVADAPGVSSFTFDGNGGSIELLAAGLTEATAAEASLIIVGPGKHLRFKNVHIYAIGLELIAIDQARWAAIQLSSPENLLRLKASLYLSIQTVRGMSEVNVAVRSSGISTGSGLCVIEPVDSRMRFTSSTGYTDIQFSVSDLRTHFTFNTVELILRMQEKYMSSVYSVAENPQHLCLQFKKVWAYAGRSDMQRISFWRPIAPPGFVVLGPLPPSASAVYCIEASHVSPAALRGCITMTPLIKISLDKLVVKSLHYGTSDVHQVSAGCCVDAFNNQQDAWEPFLEPWHGMVRAELAGKDGLEPPLSTCRVVSNSKVNINLSSVNVNHFGEAYADWLKLLESKEDAERAIHMIEHDKDEEGDTEEYTHATERPAYIVQHNSSGIDLFFRVVDKKLESREGETVCVAVERSAFTGLVLFSFTWAAKPGVNMAEIEYSSHKNSTTGHSWLSSNLEPSSNDEHSSATVHAAVSERAREGASQDEGGGGGVEVVEIFENERHLPFLGWSSSNLLPIDPKGWSDLKSKSSSKGFKEPELPAGWIWSSGWHIEVSEHVDKDGWAYFPSFLEASWPPRGTAHRALPPFSDFPLLTLGKTEELLSCQRSSTDSEHPETRWMLVESIGTPLSKRSSFTPTVDWEIVAEAPMTFCNLLPEPITLSIWSSDPPSTEVLLKEDGLVLEPGAKKGILSVHPKGRLLVCLKIRESWVPPDESEERMIIFHPQEPLPSEVTLMHKDTHRHLQVSIDRTWSATFGTLKEVTFSVPCWVDTAGCPPVVLSLSHGTSVAAIASGSFKRPWTEHKWNGKTSMNLLRSQSTKDEVVNVGTEGRSTVMLSRCDDTSVIRFALDSSGGVEEYGPDLSIATVQSQVRTSLSTWSYPLKLSVDAEVIAVVRLLRDNSRHFIRIDGRAGGATSKHMISFRHTVCFRQSGLPMTAWEVLLPKSAAAFAWEDPGGDRCLEVYARTREESTGESLESRAHPPGSMLYDLSEPGNLASLPLPAAGGRLRVQSFDCDSVRIIRFMNGGVMTGEEDQQQQQQQRDGEMAAPAGSTLERQHSANVLNKGSKMEISLDLMSVGLSIIDQRPQELLYAFSEGFLLNYRYDGQDDSSRLKLILKSLRIDNQLPLSPLPVLLFLEQKGMPEKDHVFKFLVSSRGSMKQDELAQEPWQVNVHEAIVWRLWELMESIYWEHFFAPESAGADGGAVASVQLLGSWSSLVTAAGNTKRMPVSKSSMYAHAQVRLSGATAESRRLRRSIFMEAVVRHVLRDLLHQSLRLLSGVDVLGVISSTLTALGHGASRLVHKEDMSNRHFQQALGNQLDNVGEGLLYGAEAMAKGVALGVADVLVRSRSGYETHGPPGLLLGLSKGLAGLVVHPVTGCLHSLAFLVAGVDASTASCARMVQRKPQLQRLRLPRAISADGVLHEYSKESAVGQMVLFLAEAGSYFGKHDIFRDHSKFALSDAYVNHILLPNCRILLITSRRVMMLKCPVDPAGQPDSLALVQGPSLVRWDVPWDNLLALETKYIPSFPRPDAAEAGHFAIWKPVPPEGYISLGDVAWRGLTPPPAVRVHSITPASLAAGSANAFATPDDYFLVSGLRKRPANVPLVSPPLPSSLPWY
ncbi:unnamed protein product [Closterium sp. NIES-65]|nr:unnamed protein product [Closterium sp. NIES-65]